MISRWYLEIFWKHKVSRADSRPNDLVMSDIDSVLRNTWNWSKFVLKIENFFVRGRRPHHCCSQLYLSTHGYLMLLHNTMKLLLYVFRNVLNNYKILRENFQMNENFLQITPNFRASFRDPNSVPPCQADRKAFDGPHQQKIQYNLLQIKLLH